MNGRAIGERGIDGTRLGLTLRNNLNQGTLASRPSASATRS